MPFSDTVKKLDRRRQVACGTCSLDSLPLAFPLLNLFDMSIRRKILGLEMEHSATGVVTDVTNPEALAYSARLVDSDARKAEAICHAYPTLDELQRVRSFLKRGFILEAKTLLDSIPSDHPDDDVEVLLELSRVSLFSGRWEESVRYCDQAFALKPSGVTNLTLRQVCAVACLELRNFKRCHSEIEIATSLTRLFPHASLALYLEATKLKLWLQTGRILEAEIGVAQCWKNMLAGPDLNVDNCVLLLRIELEIRRCKGLPCSDLAFATWLAARATGDDLYAALAIADIFHGAGPDIRADWFSEYQLSRNRFERLSAAGTSADAVALTMTDPQFELRPHHAETIQNLVLTRTGLVVNLKSIKIARFVTTPKMSLALRALRTGGISRESFFKEVWGNQKFSKVIHDGVVRRMIHRLRQAVPQIEIATQNGYLEIRNAYVVDA